MPNDPLEDGELVRIANWLSPDDLRIIAMGYMGFTNEELDTIWSYTRNHAMNFMTEVLRRWRNKNKPDERKVISNLKVPISVIINMGIMAEQSLGCLVKFNQIFKRNSGDDDIELNAQ